MQLEQKQPQSAAVILAATVVLIALRFIVSTSVVNDFLAPVGQVGAWLRFDRPLSEEAPAPTAALAVENAALREQLELPAQTQYQVVRADVLSKNVQSYRQTFRINRGMNDGVVEDSAVILQDRLIGRVVSASNTTAAVMLIGDPDFRAAVVVAGSDAEGVLRSESGGLIVDRVNRVGSDIAESQVVTSGLGGIFPPAIPVGTLGVELSEAGDIFAQYALTRSEPLGDIRFVDVVVGDGS